MFLVWFPISQQNYYIRIISIIKNEFSIIIDEEFMGMPVQFQLQLEPDYFDFKHELID